MEITLDQQYNIREKPIVILYTYMNRHTGTVGFSPTLYCGPNVICIGEPV